MSFYSIDSPMRENWFNFQNSYADLPADFFTLLSPTPVSDPKLVIVNHNLADSLGLDFSSLKEQELSEYFSGNKLPEGSKPLAQAYAGHQFAHFTMLGDGRAILLGEHITPDDHRFDIQFKGSGRTPYSRGGDGRAVLGPMLREYIISEAMFELGIPTTRSLAVVTTGERVRRETSLPGAILTRVASSHIRVGTFEFAAATGNKQLVEALLDYTVERHYPDLANEQAKAIALIKRMMELQAELVLHWMRVGFIHGVMNTDNMTLCGETIDYGPCAFMDAYNPRTVFSSIDRRGRYAYANQPNITGWNIARLAEALLPLIHEDVDTAVEIAQETLSHFSSLYQEKWISMMAKKLGLPNVLEGDKELISDLLDWMHENSADYTNTFRELSQSEKPVGTQYQEDSFEQWYARWKTRLKRNEEPLSSAVDLMRNFNPAVIPRNHKIEQALDAASEGERDSFFALLEALKKPYSDTERCASYQLPPTQEEQVLHTFCGT